MVGWRCHRCWVAGIIFRAEIHSLRSLDARDTEYLAHSNLSLLRLIVRARHTFECSQRGFAIHVYPSIIYPDSVWYEIFVLLTKDLNYKFEHSQTRYRQNIAQQHKKKGFRTHFQPKMTTTSSKQEFCVDLISRKSKKKIGLCLRRFFMYQPKVSCVRCVCRANLIQTHTPRPDTGDNDEEPNFSKPNEFN